VALVAARLAGVEEEEEREREDQQEVVGEVALAAVPLCATR
jgi:hypothetical protein